MKTSPFPWIVELADWVDEYGCRPIHVIDGNGDIVCTTYHDEKNPDESVGLGDAELIV